MLMRFDPFRDLGRLTQGAWGNGRQAFVPMDAYRRGDQVIVHFDLPGVDPASIDVTVEKDVLTVKAERCWEPREDDQVMVSERTQGSFTRQLFLGEGLDGDRIEARYDNGVLTLCVPVAEQAKPRKVEITTGNGMQPAIKADSVAA
jgi:HSP20 family protein